MRTKTYVISMLDDENSKIRRDMLVEQLSSYSIDHTIIEAVTPKNCSHELRQAVIANKLSVEQGITLNNRYKHIDIDKLGPACCAASHAKCLTTALNEDLDYAIIMEDDARILDHDLFKSQIESFFESSYDVFLGYFCNTMFFDDPGSFLLNRGYHISLDVRPYYDWSLAYSGVMSTVCYIVNLQGWSNKRRARQIISDLQKGVIPDLYFSCVQQPNHGFFVANKPSVGQSTNVSTIGDSSYSSYVNRAFEEDSIARYQAIEADPSMSMLHELVLHNHQDKRYVLEICYSNGRSVDVFDSKMIVDTVAHVQSQLSNVQKIVLYERANPKHKKFLTKAIIYDKLKSL